MKVLTNQLPALANLVVVLGYFDGLHLGHKALFDAARRLADQEGLQVAVLTFPESPRIALSRYTEESLKQILTPDDRLAKFQAFGVDYVYYQDFTSQFASQTGLEFLHQVLLPIQAKALVTGEDYRFGRDQDGPDFLRTHFDGQVVTVPDVVMGQARVSSTRIRQAIQKGEVSVANQLLGHELKTTGIVVHGDARGRELGYPTANIVSLYRQHLPNDGVYVVDIMVAGQRYRGAASIGKNVTFDGTEMRLEVNIFDFDKAIYGEKVDLIWLDRLRGMVKFDGIQALIQQLDQDKKAAQAWQS